MYDKFKDRSRGSGFDKLTAGKSVTGNFGDFTARQASLLPKNSLKLVPLYGVPRFPRQRLSLVSVNVPIQT